eukprot:1300729-Amorphochlora_amoeboformis.AAC.1
MVSNLAGRECVCVCTAFRMVSTSLVCGGAAIFFMVNMTNLYKSARDIMSKNWASAERSTTRRKKESKRTSLVDNNAGKKASDSGLVEAGSGAALGSLASGAGTSALESVSGPSARRGERSGMMSADESKKSDVALDVRPQ